MKLSIFFIILVIVPIIFFGTISSNVKEVNIVEQNVYKPEVKKEDNNNYDKVVALTFDDGPSKYTNDIIDTLSKYNVTATFFVIGTNLSTKYMDTFNKLIKNGNEVGIHGYSHKEFTKLKMDKVLYEIDYTKKLLNGLGIEPKYVRPPYGSINIKIKEQIEYPIILWNVDTLDWKYKNAQKIYDNSIDDIKDGGIILLHDAYLSSVKALDLLIPKLQSEGFKIVSISELFQIKGVSPQSGQIYRFI